MFIIVWKETACSKAILALLRTVWAVLFNLISSVYLCRAYEKVIIN